jgi:hypothetical protein
MQRQSQDARLRAIPKAIQEHDRLTRAKRHCIILGIIFALVLMFLPAKRNTPTAVDSTVPIIDTSGASTADTAPRKPSSRAPQA